MVAGQFEIEVMYSVDQYLMLLNTYSPYLKLEPQQKQHLFAGLRQVLEQSGDTIQLSVDVMRMVNAAIYGFITREQSELMTLNHSSDASYEVMLDALLVAIKHIK